MTITSTAAGVSTPPPGISQTATHADIQARVNAFVGDWTGEVRERAEKDTFWNEFFAIFGVNRRRVGGVFEHAAKKYSTGNTGFMDLLWPGQIAVEHKSQGVDLSTAMNQLADYLVHLPDVDMPHTIVVCDFENFRVKNLDDGTEVAFTLEELPAHIEDFKFLAGYSKSSLTGDEEQANLEATQLLANLHDRLSGYGYPKHDLRILLVRLLYILFADDTQVWSKNLFEDYIQVKTADDGSDLGSKLRDLFDVLNQENRVSNLDPTLKEFPYVNGGLFSENVQTPVCDREMRNDLLEACKFEWSKISPVIFGSLFQNVMDPLERRSLGAHFTTERDILRTIGPLFLDELEADLESALAATEARLSKLRTFRAKLPTLTFLDPACGCGNFLMLTYRELRRIELRVQLAIREAENAGHHASVFDISYLNQVKLSQFHGIEIEEFPARIAETAMHLVAHQANMEMSRAFGQYIVDLPLTKTATIHIGDALSTNWNDVVPADKCTYIVGNPPFVGISKRSDEQTKSLMAVWGKEYHGGLDFVTGWYRKTIDYVGSNSCRVAFVSTNSISQGEQVVPLWKPLMAAGFSIDFAHRTFEWVSEAKGKAHVDVVIIGYSHNSAKGTRQKKRLFDYPTVKGEPIESPAGNINPYLVEGPDVLVYPKTGSPKSPDMPSVHYGNKPTDGKNFTVNPKDYALVSADPHAGKYLRKYVGAKELLHDKDRWCLWLADLTSTDYNSSSLLQERIEAVKQFRLSSDALSTQEYARYPRLFRQIVQPATDFVCIPIHVSGARNYFPVKHFSVDVVASNATFVAEDPDGVLFSIISSSWFIAWQQAIGGRIRDDLRFYKDGVWNTFPLPPLTNTQRKSVISAGEDLLKVRDALPGTLAELYTADVMNKTLLDAHDRLDRVLDKVIAPRRRIRTEGDRLAVLFDQYVKLEDAGKLPIPSAKTR